MHGYHKASNEKVKIDWEEMSESKRNSVDPAQVVAEYGIDTTRLMVLYYSAPTHDKLWITGGMFFIQLSSTLEYPHGVKIVTVALRSSSETSLYFIDFNSTNN